MVIVGRSPHWQLSSMENPMNVHFTMAPDFTQKQMETHIFLSLAGAGHPGARYFLDQVISAEKGACSDCN
jgi:hypothetical protein